MWCYLALRGKVPSPGVFRQKQQPGAFLRRHRALWATSRRRFDSDKMKARHATKSIRTEAQSTELACASHGLQEEAWLSLASMRLPVKHVKTESSTCGYLCCYLFLFQLSLDRIVRSCMLRDAERTGINAAENGTTECSGQFLLLDVRQGESAAQQGLLLLEPFSSLAAAATGQRSCESA